MYIIESNIPLAPRRGRKSKLLDMPFDQIEVGQSFHTDLSMAKASSYCQLAAKRFGKRFSARSVGDEDARGPGVRVWRVADKATDLSALFAAPTPSPEPVKAPVRAKRAKLAKSAPEGSVQPSRRQRRAEAHAVI